MNRLFLFVLAGLAIALSIFLLAFYGYRFGFYVPNDRSEWGVFGDYFGGVLNPVFAFLAFLGVLWSLGAQAKQIRQFAVEKQSEEVLFIIRDIDGRIAALLETEVGNVDGKRIFMHHMASESERKLSILDSADSYVIFIDAARDPGSMLEAAARELRNQIISMHSFLIRYPSSGMGGYSPLIDYYIRKTGRSAQMVHEISDLPSDVAVFFGIPGRRGRQAED